MTKQSFFLSRRTIVLCIASIYCIIAGFSTQHDDGVVGTTRKNGNGCICHSFTSSNGVNVSISGPATVNAGTSHTYTLTMSGGPAVTGGFNVATQFGTLSSSTADVQVMTGELTQVSPKTFPGSTVQWTFTYTAPAAPVYDTLYSVGNSVNNNTIPDNGDQWNYGPNFIINVIPVGQPVPLLSIVGFCLLSVLLVGVAISYFQTQGASRQS